MDRRYEVCFLDEDGSQKSGGYFSDFLRAQQHRDDLIHQGYEAWIEDAVPFYVEPQPPTDPAPSALPGEAEVVAHAYVVDGECEQLEWGTEYDLPDDPALVKLVTLASLQAMQARAEKAERERDEMRLPHSGVKLSDVAATIDADTIEALRTRAEDAEARVKELEEALSLAARTFDNIRSAVETNQVVDKDVHGTAIRGRDASRTALTLKGGSNG